MSYMVNPLQAGTGLSIDWTTFQLHVSIDNIYIIDNSGTLTINLNENYTWTGAHLFTASNPLTVNANFETGLTWTQNLAGFAYNSNVDGNADIYAGLTAAPTSTYKGGVNLWAYIQTTSGTAFGPHLAATFNSIDGISFYYFSQSDLSTLGTSFNVGLYDATVKTLNNTLDDGSGNLQTSGQGKFNFVDANIDNTYDKVIGGVAVLSLWGHAQGQAGITNSYTIGISSLSVEFMTDNNFNFWQGGLSTATTPSFSIGGTSNGSGTLHLIKTYNNTLDDGSGNMTIAGIFKSKNSTGLYNINASSVTFPATSFSILYVRFGNGVIPTFPSGVYANHLISNGLNHDDVWLIANENSSNISVSWGSTYQFALISSPYA